METERRFQLALREEQRFEFPVTFIRDLPSGRTTVPYVVRTCGGGREGERHGFFAVHALQPPVEALPRLLFHASLDDAAPAESMAGALTSVLENPVFVPGRHGQALGEKTEAWSFNLVRCLRAEQGTFAVWVRVPSRQGSMEHGLLRARGCGYPFLGIYTDYLAVSGVQHRLELGVTEDGKPDDRWRHVALTWDLGEVGFHVDGELLAKQKRESLEVPTGELWALPQGVAAFDDVRTYSVVLPAAEIRSLAQGEP